MTVFSFVWHGAESLSPSIMNHEKIAEVVGITLNNKIGQFLLHVDIQIINKRNNLSLYMRIARAKILIIFPLLYLSLKLTLDL